MIINNLPSMEISETDSNVTYLPHAMYYQVTSRDGKTVGGTMPPLKSAIVDPPGEPPYTVLISIYQDFEPSSSVSLEGITDTTSNICFTYITPFVGKAETPGNGPQAFVCTKLGPA